MEHPLRAFRRSQVPPISLDAAADVLGVSKTTLSRIENREQHAQPELMRRIADWTGNAVSPEQMIAAGPAPATAFHLPRPAATEVTPPATEAAS